MRFFVRFSRMAPVDMFQGDYLVPCLNEAKSSIKEMFDTGFGPSVWYAVIMDMKLNRRCIVYADKNKVFHKTSWRTFYSPP